jgi:hypothetical protein
MDNPYRHRIYQCALHHKATKIDSKYANVETPVLLSLVRNREEILAWVSTASHESGRPAVTTMSLAKLDPRVFPGRDALLADWLSLVDASDISSVWAAFWRVFWVTLSEPQDVAPSAMPRHAAPRARPVATAAHPPKPAGLVLDFHAWLADDRLLDRFFLHHDFARCPVLDIHGQSSIDPGRGKFGGLSSTIESQLELPPNALAGRQGSNSGA